MSTRSLLTASLVLCAPLGAQDASETSSCCAQAPAVVQVHPAAPRARTVALQTPASDRGYLGVRIAIDDDGAEVVEVMPGGGARAAGLAAGDRLVRVDGKELGGEDLSAALAQLQAGSEVTVAYRRSGALREARVPLFTLERIEERAAQGHGEEEPILQWMDNGVAGSGSAPAHSERGYIGITLTSDSGPLTVGGVRPGSGGAAAGFQAGDVILSVDGKAGDTQDLLEVLRGKHVGDTITVRYRRDGEERKAQVELGPGEQALAVDMLAPATLGLEKAGDAPQIVWHTAVAGEEPAEAGEAQTFEIHLEADADGGSEAKGYRVWTSRDGTTPFPGQLHVDVQTDGDDTPHVVWGTQPVKGQDVPHVMVLRAGSHDDDADEHEHEHEDVRDFQVSPDASGQRIRWRQWEDDDDEGAEQRHEIHIVTSDEGGRRAIRFTPKGEGGDARKVEARTLFITGDGGHIVTGDGDHPAIRWAQAGDDDDDAEEHEVRIVTKVAPGHQALRWHQASDDDDDDDDAEEHEDIRIFRARGADGGGQGMRTWTMRIGDDEDEVEEERVLEVRRPAIRRQAGGDGERIERIRILGAPQGAQGPAPDARVRELEREVRDLERRIRELERALEAPRRRRR